MKKENFEIEIFVDSEEKYLPRKKIRDAVLKTLHGEKIRAARLNIILVTDDNIEKLNEKYLSHNFPTDVLAFDLSEDGDLEGEIYISVETARRQAKEYGETFARELKRLAVHGTLHLIGYSDKTKDGKQIMRGLEDKYIT